MPEAYDIFDLTEVTVQMVPTPTLDVGDIVNIRKPSLYVGNATATRYLYLLTDMLQPEQLAQLTESINILPDETKIATLMAEVRAVSIPISDMDIMTISSTVLGTIQAQSDGVTDKVEIDALIAKAMEGLVTQYYNIKFQQKLTVFNRPTIWDNESEIPNPVYDPERVIAIKGSMVYKCRYGILPADLVSLGVDMDKGADPTLVHQPLILMGHDLDEQGGLQGRYTFLEIGENGQHLSAPIDVTGLIWDKNTQDYLDVGNL